jgi:hypothetical protein
MGFIYKLNFPNGKAYIGKTTRNVKDRIREHKQASNKCPALKKAIDKYIDFETEVLIEINDELLDHYEEKFILVYDTIVPNGYNLTYGGEGGKHCDETKEKLRILKSGFKHSEETINKMKISHSNRIVHDDWKQKISNGLKGHSVSNETKKKMSESRIKNPIEISNETRNKMRISLSSIKVRQQMSQNHRKDKNSDIPMYIHRIQKERYSGYAVRIPNEKEKSFVSMKLSDEDKLQLAIDYIKSNYNGEGSTTKC